MEPTTTPQERPPIVVIVGHVDHGKSTLLDYIRRTNIVDSEIGGITQHLSAYEVVHQSAAGARQITFLDTPGHAAFHGMRSRGLEVADVAVLVVSSEEGVKEQTIEAIRLITEAHIPYIVAFTKIDKPGSDIERAKLSLLEQQVFLEGMGGEIPYVAVSGKTGAGIPELLDLILLAGELEGLTAHSENPGEGVVIEVHTDPRRGNTATLIVKDGSVESGEFIVSGKAFAPVRIMENFLGKAIPKALPGSPVRIVGFSSLPKVGAAWRAVETKKQAEEAVMGTETKKVVPPTTLTEEENKPQTLPIMIKTDFAGTGEAVMHEIERIPLMAGLELRIVGTNVGSITEGDVRVVGAGAMPGIILGFNVKIEKEAKELAERTGVTVAPFDIIYKLSDWLRTEIETRRPRTEEESIIASAHIVKVFSTLKNRVVIGGKVTEGILTAGSECKIMRRDMEIGRGEIISLQSQKTEVKKVEEGKEFGAMLKTSATLGAGDILLTYETKLV